MFWRDVLVLTAVALLCRSAAALVVPWAPYLDSSYYALVAERLATGHGFTVPAIWSFLDVGGQLPADPTLPIPSNAHWPPLGPLVSAGAMALFGPTWQAGQIPMVLLSAAIPGLTYLVARDFFGGRSLAIGAGILAIFSGPLFILYPSIDNFALIGVTGTVVLWMSARAVRSGTPDRWLVGAGVVAGLAALTRIDGALLTMAPATAWLIGRGWLPWRPLGGRPSFRGGFASAAVFLAVVAPWLLRQATVFGSALPSAGGHTLWITGYNEQFSIGHEVSLATYLAWGWENIIGSKVASWGIIAGRTMVLMGGFLVFSFIGGMISSRERSELAPFHVYFVVIFLLMGGAFTFHAPQSAWYHTSPAWLGFGLPLALAGIAPTADAFGRWWRFLKRPQTQAFLGVVGIAAAVVLSVLGSLNLWHGWVSGRERDVAAASYFIDEGLTNDVVMYREAAALNLLSGNPTVAFPYDPYPVIEEVIRAYDVRWVVVARSAGELRAPLGLWEGGRAVDDDGNRADFLADTPAIETEDVRIFEVMP